MYLWTIFVTSARGTRTTFSCVYIHQLQTIPHLIIVISNTNRWIHHESKTETKCRCLSPHPRWIHPTETWNNLHLTRNVLYLYVRTRVINQRSPHLTVITCGFHCCSSMIPFQTYTSNIDDARARSIPQNVGEGFSLVCGPPSAMRYLFLQQQTREGKDQQVQVRNNLTTTSAHKVCTVEYRPRTTRTTTSTRTPTRRTPRIPRLTTSH